MLTGYVQASTHPRKQQAINLNLAARFEDSINGAFDSVRDLFKMCSMQENSQVFSDMLIKYKGCELFL